MKRIGIGGTAAIGCLWFVVACSGDDDFDPSSDNDQPDATTSSSSGGGATSSGGGSSGGATSSSGGSSGGATSSSGGSSSGDGGAELLQRTTGPTASVLIDDFMLIGQFYANDTVVRDPASSECLAILRDANSAPADAGAVTLGGAVVGTEGGLAEEVSFDADPDTKEYFFFGDDGIFAPGGGHTLSVGVAGNATFPAASVPALVTPNLENATITSPALSAERTVGVPTATDLNLAWTSPEDVADQSLTLTLTNENAGNTAKLICVFPANTGAGRVPASLLTVLRENNSDAIAEVDLGGTVIAGGEGGATYVVQVRRLESTNWSSLFEEPSLVTVTFE